MSDDEVPSYERTRTKGVSLWEQQQGNFLDAALAGDEFETEALGDAAVAQDWDEVLNQPASEVFEPELADSTFANWQQAAEANQQRADELQGTVSRLEEENKDLRDKQLKQLELLRKVTEEVEALKAKGDALKQQLEQREQDLLSAQTSLNAAETIAEAAKEREEQYKQEVEEAKSALEQAENEKKELAAQGTAEELKAKEEEVARLREQMETVESKATAAGEELKAKEDEIKQLKDKESALSQQVSEKETELKKIKEEREQVLQNASTSPNAQIGEGATGLSDEGKQLGISQRQAGGCCGAGSPECSIM